MSLLAPSVPIGSDRRYIIVLNLKNCILHLNTRAKKSKKNTVNARWWMSKFEKTSDSVFLNRIEESEWSPKFSAFSNKNGNRLVNLLSFFSISCNSHLCTRLVGPKSMAKNPSWQLKRRFFQSHLDERFVIYPNTINVWGDIQISISFLNPGVIYRPPKIPFWPHNSGKIASMLFVFPWAIFCAFVQGYANRCEPWRGQGPRRGCHRFPDTSYSISISHSFTNTNRY